MAPHNAEWQAVRPPNVPTHSTYQPQVTNMAIMVCGLQR